jgi:RNA polymerase sigma-70 factor (ECF subfamily)
MRRESGPDLTALALAAGQGDHVALRAFVHDTQAQVWQLCAYLASPAQADDLAQETYVRALGALPRYRGEAPAIHWLLRIARNTVADEIRRARRRRDAWRRLTRHTSAYDHLAEPDPTGAVDLGQLLHELPHDRREAFVLTQLLGFRYAEAASICDVPVGTIRSRVTRAREQAAGLARAARSV